MLKYSREHVSDLLVGDGAVVVVPREVDLFVVLVENEGTHFDELGLRARLRHLVRIGHVELKDEGP